MALDNGILTMSSRCICGKICKNNRGLKIHQSRMKCLVQDNAAQRTGLAPGNKYIDTTVQKGGIPGVPGCLEHTGVVTLLIRQAREGNGDLSVLWLDLANAYGSIPHKLVEITLARHHIPHKIKDLVLNYYRNFRLGVMSGSITSSWHRLEKGIITGCTISDILFALAMNMLVKAAETECRGPLSKSGIRHLPMQTFMDDLNEVTNFSFHSAAREEEFRVSRTREALAYRDSSDPRVAAAGIAVRTGMKFKVRDGLKTQGFVRHSGRWTSRTGGHPTTSL
ncbi:hypothetical protein NFI96_003045 [Prochilodus magdalenae]|nr:hypothetical protein NFI96_003045 [Prochilodus magdalenae]